MEILKALLRMLLRWLYRVEVRGIEHFHAAGPRVLIIANHTSFLDAVLLAAFLPDRLTFAINTRIAQAWWLRPFLRLIDAFPMDPTNPLSTKSLIRYLREDRKAVIFPEGRITVTGSLMKVYQGPGLVADKSAAMLLPVRIEGAQYTPFSRLRGRVRLRWFPRIRMTLLPPRRLELPASVTGHERRDLAGTQLSDLMSEMIFATGDYHRTLMAALLDARRVHGGGHIVIEDVQRRPLSYNALLRKAFILGGLIARDTQSHETIGILLPNTTSCVVGFVACHAYGRVPAMLNYTTGVEGMVSAVQTARIRVVYTARRFVAMAKLEAAVDRLAQHVRIVYLEDLQPMITPLRMLAGVVQAWLPAFFHRRAAGTVRPDAPAVVLFTSGSEGTPKGVVLSHTNLLANREQLTARVDFSAQDVILNALPLFHSFGLTAGTLLPLFSGIRVFFYPSPLHYRIVPEVAYDINATMLFGTNTFLSGYARFAHPYDFYSVRYVFAGAEKVQDETRRVWAEKFGIRIFEGYGATETGPVLSTNTAMYFRAGSVGRLLPGIRAHLTPVPGVADAGRLAVCGPNVMLGYYLHDHPGVLQPPATGQGAGWYDTGDIVHIDADGYVWIRGRAKRFAKIGGEMISLARVEQLAARVWPDAAHAVVHLPDPARGEQLVLVTEQAGAERAALQAGARADGLGELHVPRRILAVADLPLLGTGKIDYKAVLMLVESAVSDTVDDEADAADTEADA